MEDKICNSECGLRKKYPFSCSLHNCIHLKGNKIMEEIKIKYNDYEHRKTGLKIKAIKFKFGMEDGWDKHRPYVIAWKYGFKRKIEVSEKKYIILRKEYKFIFDEKEFKKLYKRIK
jgi:hypothetical protein